MLPIYTNNNNTLRKLTVIAALLISPFSSAVYAQKTNYPAAINVARQEFDAQDGYVNEKVTQMEGDGLLVSSRSVKPEEGEWQFRYQIFNSNLEEVQQHQLTVNRVRTGLQTNTLTFLSPTHFHQLIFGKQHFTIHSIARKGKAKPVEVEGDFPVSGSVQYMTVIQQRMVITVNTKQGVSLLFIDWKSGDVITQALPLPEGAKPKNVTVLNFQELPNIQSVATIVRVRPKKSPMLNFCFIHSAEGALQRTIDITPTEEMTLISVRVSSVKNEQYIFAGTYSNSTRTTATYSAQGVFFAESDNQKLKYLTKTNFLDLKNFLDFLPQKSQDRIEKRQQKAENRGGELSYNYLMTIHPIVVTADGYFLVGEAFYPEYHSETYYINGKPQTRRVFDGYQYTHSILVKFDASGKRVMDQCLAMHLVDLPMYVVQNVSLNVSVPGQITLSYATDRYIVSKTFSDAGTEIAQRQSEVIGTGDENERVRQSTATLRHWYGPNFVAYGFQTIKNSNSGKRRVFYITKLQIGN